YDADDARRIAGRKSSEIEAILGYAGRAAMVHLYDMVMTAQIGSKSERQKKDAIYA
ncbi:glutamate 5-kinase, partial [Rhizobium ruizarguesonis]